MLRIKIITLFLIAVILGVACSEERQPIFIEGVWEASYFEAIDCEDTLQNISIDFALDSTYFIAGDSVKFVSYIFSFDQANTEYNLERNSLVNGNPVTTNTNGTYLSSGFNDIFLCKTNCQDSLWDFGLFVRTDDQIDISWQDTLDQKCGFLFKGFRVN